jgi:hypothetical protein
VPGLVLQRLVACVGKGAAQRGHGVQRAQVHGPAVPHNWVLRLSWTTICRISRESSQAPTSLWYAVGQPDPPMSDLIWRLFIPNIRVLRHSRIGCCEAGRGTPESEDASHRPMD